MRCLAVLAGCCFLFSAWFAPAADPAPAPKPSVDFFEKSVRPLLVNHCFECHGPGKQKGGLRLDSRAGMLAGGDSGPVMTIKNLDESLFLKAIHYKDSPKMPPKGALAAEQVAVLETWIKQGAPWPETDALVRPVTKETGFKITEKDRVFWAFRPVADPPLPAVKDQTWAKNSIDRFILAKLEEKGLSPSPPADPRTLIRRVTFDLIGLPPTPEEVEAFVKESASGGSRPRLAYEKVVDRLLASPHYGERQARHWLDVARYGEDQAHTFAARKYPQGFRYRDWLVKAFNDDMPYDRFITEQIAADLLETPDRKEHMPALGFFALGPVYYGDPKKLDQYDDRIDTLSRGFLGLTVACARCHDHKFDPISTKDYYSLAGVFASTDYVEFPLVSPEEVEEAKKAQSEQDKKNKTPPKYPFVHALKEGPAPTNLKVHVRGNPATLGEDAPRRFLGILAGDDPPPFAIGSGRLELARAIASKDNPLTARVLVNRLWQHHFGTGLVRTPSNFGALGERPSHPELLDHLATKFMKGEPGASATGAPPSATGAPWSIKALHREIVLSATYQQSSRLEPKSFEIDPGNQLLWRMNRQRLQVEAWRDAMLAVSGTLDATLGGPSTDLNAADNRRRTLYGLVSRHDLNPLLRLFDFPDPNITSDARPTTTVPLQQLFVLNSEFMVRNARALAGHLATDADNDEARIRRAYLLLFSRPASDRELKLGLAYLAKPPEENPKLSRWERYAQVLLSSNEFLYVD